MLPRFGNLGGDNSNFRAGFGQDADLITSSHLKTCLQSPKALSGKSPHQGPMPVALPLATHEGDIYASD